MIFEQKAKWTQGWSQEKMHSKLKEEAAQSWDGGGSRGHTEWGGGLVSQMVAKGGSAIARSASQKWGVVRSWEDFEQDDDKLWLTLH